MKYWPAKDFPLGLHLLIMMLIALVPTLAFAVYLVQELTESKEAFEKQDILESARELARNIDMETHSTARLLHAMGASSALKRGDLEQFYAEAREVLTGLPSWHTIILLSSEGQVLFNTLDPYGKPRATIVEPKSFEEARKKGGLVIGQATRGPEGLIALPIRVAIEASKERKYILTAVIPLATWQRHVETGGHHPNIWTRTIVDQHGLVLARSRSPEKFVGTSATPSFRDLMARNEELVVEERTLDHVPVFLALSRSKLTGWTAAVAAPKDLILEPAIAAIQRLISVGFSLILFFGSFAVLAGFRISRSIRKLAKIASSLGETYEYPAVSTSIKEITLLGNALQRSGRELQKKEEARQEVLSRLEAANAEAMEGMRAKDQFLAMLGHELRNPLGALTNALEIMKMVCNSCNPEAVEARAIMERQINLANGLLSDLLDVSRISRGKLHLTRKRVDLNQVLQLTIVDYEHLFREKKVQVEKILPDRPVWVLADAGRLSQSLGNILHNAHKFTESGGTVRIELLSRGQVAVISVKDTGPGFDEGVLPNLFEPFSQAEQDFARSQGGLGLGLAVVKGLIELHGGHVSAENRADQPGACVTIELPLAAQETAPAVISAEPLPDSPSLSLRILLVEDNPDACATLCSILQIEGHTVFTAEKGEEGVEMAIKVTPDIIICDLGLPDIDGYEVCRRLRNSGKLEQTLIFALSGYAQESDVDRAKEAGFDQHFQKPLKLDDLRREIQKTR